MTRVKRKSARWHTIYSIITSLAQEAGIALLLLWLFPLFGVKVPFWIVIALLAGFPIFAYMMYRIGHPTILYKEVSAPESIVGQIGTVEKRLDPEGYIKINGELWRSLAEDGPIKEGEEVTVTAIEGLRLTVVKRDHGGHA